jgi:hypothetical protein
MYFVDFYGFFQVSWSKICEERKKGKRRLMVVCTLFDRALENFSLMYPFGEVQLPVKTNNAEV